MSARIFEFRPVKAGRKRLALTDGKPAVQDLATGYPFEFWAGVSGERYVHSVFSLIECPEVPAANYVLVARDDMGRRRSLRVGRVEEDAPSLNLAHIRHVGATLGASEVHVHLLGGSIHRRRMIELDIATAEGAQPLRAANH